MNNGGDAAEEVVRLSLEGFEVVARLTGSAAKNIGVLIYTILKQENKTKGAARLSNMIKSGKPLKVFSVAQKDLKTFTAQAKKYGVLYNVLRNRTNNSPNAEVDIIVREEDASKIQRIVDRFALSKVDKAAIVTDAQRDIAQREEISRDVPTQSRGERIYDEAMGVTPQRERNAHENPIAAKTEKSSPSRLPSEQGDSRADRGRVKPVVKKKPSVRAEIQRYKEQSRKLKESGRGIPQPKRQNPVPENRQTVHTQPRRKKQKER